MSANLCVCCGAVIPEGRQVCPVCEHKAERPTAPCVACRYSERIRELKLVVFCEFYGRNVPILHTCEYGDRRTEKEIQKITNHYKTERKYKQ